MCHSFAFTWQSLLLRDRESVFPQGGLFAHFEAFDGGFDGLEHFGIVKRIPCLCWLWVIPLINAEAALLVCEEHDVTVRSLLVCVVGQSLLFEVAQLAHITEHVPTEALVTIIGVQGLVHFGFLGFDSRATIVTLYATETLSQSLGLYEAESRIVVTPVRVRFLAVDCGVSLFSGQHLIDLLWLV